jgi:hypothetical protein
VHDDDVFGVPGGVGVTVAGTEGTLNGDGQNA